MSDNTNDKEADGLQLLADTDATLAEAAQLWNKLENPREVLNDA